MRPSPTTIVYWTQWNYRVDRSRFWCDLPQQLSFNLNHLIGLIVALYRCDLPQQQLFVNINHLIGLIVALYRCDLPQELFIRINHFDGLTLRYPGNPPSQPSTWRIDCCIIGATFKDQIAKTIAWQYSVGAWLVVSCCSMVNRCIWRNIPQTIHYKKKTSLSVIDATTCVRTVDCRVVALKATSLLSRQWKRIIEKTGAYCAVFFWWFSSKFVSLSLYDLRGRLIRSDVAGDVTSWPPRDQTIYKNPFPNC